MTEKIDVSPNALRLFAARNTRRDTPIRSLIHAAADRIEELEKQIGKGKRHLDEAAPAPAEDLVYSTMDCPHLPGHRCFLCRPR